MTSDELLYRLVRAVGGDGAVKVVECLKASEELTDDEVALRMGVKPNEVRKILYRFAGSNLVSVKRLRDEKTGWYIFKWRLQPDQLEGYVLNQKKDVLQKLGNRLEYERSHSFYHCPAGCPRVTFEDAMEATFSCPVCRKPLEHVNNQAIIQALEKKIGQLQSELSNPV